MGQGPCHRLSPSFRSEKGKDRGRWSDGEEDRGLCFASESHRWRVMIMQQQTEDRERRRKGEKKGEEGEKEVSMVFQKGLDSRIYTVKIQNSES